MGRRDKGRQGEHTCGETMGDKGTQGLGKANTPANTCWKTMGDKGRPSNTGTNVGRHCETMGGKTSARRTHHPTQARMRGEWEKRGDKTLGTRTRQHRHMWGDGRQGETRRGGGHTIHQRETKGGHMGRQDLGKVDTPSNTGTHMWRQGETRPRADTPSQAHMWGKTSGRRAHRDNARQWVTRPRERRTHHRVSMGDTGRHFVFFATVSGEFCYGGQVWCFLRRS